MTMQEDKVVIAGPSWLEFFLGKVSKIVKINIAKLQFSSNEQFLIYLINFKRLSGQIRRKW